MVQHLSRNATKIYQLSGTTKFEIPKDDVRIADVFQAVEDAKTRFPVYAWGLADTVTLIWRMCSSRLHAGPGVLIMSCHDFLTTITV
ncbi:hypothetical protein ACOSQ3_024870 [Xanthoceras sorbifolium]